MEIVARILSSAKRLADIKIVLVIVAGSLVVSCGGGGGGGSGLSASSDAIAVDFPVFYVKKPLVVDEGVDPAAAGGVDTLEQVDLRNLMNVSFGADLYARPRASSSAGEINITGELTGGFGDVRDVTVSHDGEKVLFAMRFPVDPEADEDEQPFWNIWEYNIEEDVLRPIIADAVRADEGHDIAPHYLPDGRIVFSSSRQSRSTARLIDQFRPQYAALDDKRRESAFVLHVMDDDGSNIEQISFNQSHDMYTTVLSDGRVLFSRWDAKLGNDAIHLYTANPDGSDMQLLYGAESHQTGTDGSTVQFVKAQELPDGRIMALLTPFSGIAGTGDVVVIDTQTYLNNEQSNEFAPGLPGPAQESASFGSALTIPGISENGRFIDFWPLWDGTNRVLISWTDCRVTLGDDPQVRFCLEENLADESAREALPAFGVWMYDPVENTQRPVVLAEPGISITDVVVAENRARPAIRADVAFNGADPELLNDDAGILHIRSVYDVDGVDNSGPGIDVLADPARTLAAERRARFVRIYRPVGLPPREVFEIDNAAFGRTTFYGMREIVGYAPVEPDGSVRIKVPADVPLGLDVLDADGRRLSARHEHWLQVRPGEVRECNGCHVINSGISHGREDAFTTVNNGADGTGPFPNTQPAVFPLPGETMAETRTRRTPAALDMSTDLAYADVWTYQPDAGRAPDDDSLLTYATIVETPQPEMYNCEPWTVGCRVIINYEDQIQPLWERSRPELDPLTGLPVVDPETLEEIDRRCVDCHAFRDSDNAVIDPRDRGQLELTSDPSVEPEQVLSYRELFFTDFEEELVDPDTVAQVLRFQGRFDEETEEPILEPVSLGSRLSAGSARAGNSEEFLQRFDEVTGDHPGWLTADELRLISEWLDLGAQYYNDPFASAP